jgi:GNAT superfamily N-acetyltransferase
VSDHITVRPARADELDTVAELWDEASRWLGSRGIDQWQYPPRRETIAHNIAAGECWLVEEEGRVIGTITVDDCADEEFWRPEDDPDDALYLHRMVTIREVAGREIGSALLDWASRRAASLGKQWVRLDAWRSNRELQRYYMDRRFQYVRTMDLPHRRSGALFQRPAGATLGRGPSIAEKTGPIRPLRHPPS